LDRTAAAAAGREGLAGLDGLDDPLGRQDRPVLVDVLPLAEPADRVDPLLVQVGVDHLQVARALGRERDVRVRHPHHLLEDHLVPLAPQVRPPQARHARLDQARLPRTGSGLNLEWLISNVSALQPAGAVSGDALDCTKIRWKMYFSWPSG
jgi:hypothetical protein